PVQEPQPRLAPPTCRTPPGQYTGIRQAHPGNSLSLRFRCHLLVSTLQQRFAHARLPSPHLTRHARLFPDRSPRRSSANAARGGLTPPPEGRRRRATTPSSPAQHHIKRIYLHRTPLCARGALKIKLGAGVLRAVLRCDAVRDGDPVELPPG